MQAIKARSNSIEKDSSKDKERETNKKDKTRDVSNEKEKPEKTSKSTTTTSTITANKPTSKTTSKPTVVNTKENDVDFLIKVCTQRTHLLLARRAQIDPIFCCELQIQNINIKFSLAQFAIIICTPSYRNFQP